MKKKCCELLTADSNQQRMINGWHRLLLIVIGNYFCPHGLVSIITDCFEITFVLLKAALIMVLLSHSLHIFELTFSFLHG